MTIADRLAHAPEFQTGAHVAPSRPACWRAEVEARACGSASNPDAWASLVAASPGCEGCGRAIRAAMNYWGAA